MASTATSLPSHIFKFFTLLSTNPLLPTQHTDSDEFWGITWFSIWHSSGSAWTWYLRSRTRCCRCQCRWTWSSPSPRLGTFTLYSFFLSFFIPLPILEMNLMCCGEVSLMCDTWVDTEFLLLLIDCSIVRIRILKHFILDRFECLAF